MFRIVVGLDVKRFVLLVEPIQIVMLDLMIDPLVNANKV